jgi:hypothetical protein
MVPPNMTICLPFFQPQQLMDYLYGTRHQAKLITNALNSSFEKTASWQEFQTDPWSATVIVFSQAYMSTIYATEAMRGYEENPLNYIYDKDDITSQVISNVLVKKLLQWNVTLGQFKNVFGQKFLDFYPTTMTLLRSNQTKLLTNQELVLVTEEQVCYKFVDGSVQLELNDKITVEINNINTAGGVIYVSDGYSAHDPSPAFYGLYDTSR